MARIAGVELPKEKRIDVGLTYIYGIGRSRAQIILNEADIQAEVRVKDLKEDQINRLQTVIRGEYKVEGELKRIVDGSIKHLIEIGTYRGSRHRRGLPARGQRTKTNARTRRGKKRTVGTVKIKEQKKEEVSA